MESTEAAIERAPVPEDSTIPRDEEISYLTGILKRIFPDGNAALGDQERCVRILRFVVSHHRLDDNVGTATKILRDGHAICGGLAEVFNTLVRMVGIPARRVSLYNLPIQGGHTASEAYYCGQWHLYDATFGVFFFSKSTFSREGEVLSLRELLAAPSSGTMMKVVAAPWGGYRDDRAQQFRVRPAERDYLATVYPTPLPAMYRDYLQTAFPVACDSDTLISFPVNADLEARSEITIGSRDGSARDVEQATSLGTGRGASYIGNGAPAAVHTVTIKAPKGTMVEIEYSLLEKRELFFFPLVSSRLLSEQRGGDGRTTFRVMQVASESVAMITCPQGWAPVDAIQIRRVGPRRGCGPCPMLAQQK
jgi:hypothetical protein